MEVGQEYNPHRMFHGAFVPKWLLKREEISQGAKLCFGLLMEWAGDEGDCEVDPVKLASSMGVRQRQAENYLKELRDASLVRSMRQGRGANAVYAFIWHAWASQAPKRKRRLEPQDSAVQRASEPQDITQYTAVAPYSGTSNDVRTSAEQPNHTPSEPLPDPKRSSGSEVAVPGDDFEQARRIVNRQVGVRFELFGSTGAAQLQPIYETIADLVRHRAATDWGEATFWDAVEADIRGPGRVSGWASPRCIVTAIRKVGEKWGQVAASAPAVAVTFTPEQLEAKEEHARQLAVFKQKMTEAGIYGKRKGSEVIGAARETTPAVSGMRTGDLGSGAHQQGRGGAALVEAGAR